MRSRLISGFVSVALGAGCFTTVRVQAPPGAPLDVRTGTFPHHVYEEVLSQHVDDQGRVDYEGLSSHRGPLERYLASVARVSPHSEPDLFPTEADALAYWLNAYNAYVLFAVTQRPDMRSVNDSKLDFFYFTEYVFGGESLSLHHVEHEIVRREFNDPRIHLALNHASAGCPELPREPFLPDRLDEQLARQSRQFCADEGRVRVEDGELRVSPIFDWYAEDFTSTGGAIGFCQRWGRDLPEGADVDYLEYDWSLNAQPGRALFE